MNDISGQAKETLMDEIQQVLNFKVGSFSLGNIVEAIIIYYICSVVIKFLMRPIGNLIDKLAGSETLGGFLKTVVRVILNFVAVIIVADSLGIPIASLVAIFSMLGLAIALSVQGALSNLTSGIMLIATKPILVGEYVEVDGIQGVVKEISLLCTKVLSVDNKLIIVSNATMNSKTIINYSREPQRRVDLSFSASYDSSIDIVKAAILEVLNGEEKILKAPAPFVRVSAYKDSSIEYVVRVWVNNGDYWDVYFDTLEKVKASFDAHGISMTYPHINVHMDK